MYKVLTRGPTLAAALVLIACTQDVTAPAGTAGSGGSGNDTECRGAFLTGPHDNIVVPPRSSCFITGAIVNGHVKVLEGSLLVMRASTVGGNVDGDKADIVRLLGNQILGNIQIKEGGSDGRLSFTHVCGNNLPNGNIQIEKMRDFVHVGGPFCVFEGGGNALEKGNIKVEDNIIGVPPFRGDLFVGDNTVGGNLQVFRNVGPGPKTVQLNTVRENLQCFENTPPFIGGPNVAGMAEGQCF